MKLWGEKLKQMATEASGHRTFGLTWPLPVELEEAIDREWRRWLLEEARKLETMLQQAAKEVPNAKEI